MGISMFKVENVTKIYSQGEQSLTALLDIFLEFEDSGFVSIVGESGSGKTTLLNVLAGFDEVSQGEIYFEGKNLSFFSEEEKNSYYSEDVGFVFQEYNVLEELTVWDNVALALEILNISVEQKSDMINSVLNKVCLDNVKDKQVSKLSGGQKQRVAIARAYVKNPKVILADEPTGNLDHENSEKIFEMLKDIAKDTLVIVVTHNEGLGEKYSDRIIKLSDGKVEFDNILTKEKYIIEICHGTVQKKVEKISDILGFIKSYPDEKNEYLINVKKVEIQECKREEVYCAKERYEKKPLQKKKIFTLAKKILAKRRIRQILSIGIFALTSFLLLLFINIAFYDEDRVVTDYLERYDEKAVLVEMELDSLYTYSESGDTAYVTKDIEHKLIKLSDSNIFYQFNEVELSNDDHMADLEEEQTEKVLSIFSDARVMSDKILKEEYFIDNLTDSEFVINEALANEAGISDEDIGKSYFLNGKRATLKGIIQSKEKPLIYFSQAYIASIKEQNSHRNISVSGNFLKSKSLFEYVNSHIGIGDISKAEYTDMIGNIPVKENEVVLSYDFISQNMESEKNIESVEDIIGKTYNLKNLYSEEYGNSLSKNMNLYDYLGKTITVVGIADFDGDVLVKATVYNKISEEYYGLYRYDRIGYYMDKWDGIVQQIHGHGLRISDDNLKNVYMLVDMKPALIKYIVFILSIMTILTIFLMTSLIGYSIKDNSKVIGILQAIGINKNDIKKIFMIEPIKIMIVSFCIAIPLVVMTINAINTEYSNSLIGRAYEILPLSIPSVLIVLIITTTIGSVTTLLPLKELEKKTIIETIKS